MTKLKPSKGSSLAFIMQTRSSTGPFREKGGENLGQPQPLLYNRRIRRKRRIEKKMETTKELELLPTQKYSSSRFVLECVFWPVERETAGQERRFIQQQPI
jgi:hypothetical protein